jgi:hypothetical protein
MVVGVESAKAMIAPLTVRISFTLSFIFFCRQRVQFPAKTTGLSCIFRRLGNSTQHAKTEVSASQHIGIALTTDVNAS